MAAGQARAAAGQARAAAGPPQKAAEHPRAAAGQPRGAQEKRQRRGHRRRAQPDQRSHGTGLQATARPPMPAAHVSAPLGRPASGPAERGPDLRPGLLPQPATWRAAAPPMGPDRSAGAAAAQGQAVAGPLLPTSAATAPVRWSCAAAAVPAAQVLTARVLTARVLTGMSLAAMILAASSSELFRGGPCPSRLAPGALFPGPGPTVAAAREGPAGVAGRSCSHGDPPTDPDPIPQPTLASRITPRTLAIPPW
jgi:hypothetical protein